MFLRMWVELSSLRVFRRGNWDYLKILLTMGSAQIKKGPEGPFFN
jgi:hypothetical protein